MSIIPQKRCLKCGADKPLSEFSKNSYAPDGYRTQCKACISIASADYYARNTDQVKDKAKRWAADNPERVRLQNQQKRARCRANPITPDPDKVKRCGRCASEKSVAEFVRNTNRYDGLSTWCRDCERVYAAEWRSKNRDRVRERIRIYQQLPRMQQARRAWRDRNREKRRAAQRLYDQRHPEKRRERVMRRNARKRRATIGTVSYQAIWIRDQGMCHLCGLPVQHADCHFDHIIPLAKGGAHAEFNIAVAHSWCNQQKSDRLT